MVQIRPSLGSLDEAGDVTSKTVLPTLVPLLGVLPGELLLSVEMVGPALWLYVTTLLLCTLLPLRIPTVTPVLSGFAFLVAFRLVNLSMPVFTELTIYWILSVYVPFVAAGTWFLWQSETVDADLDLRGTLLWAPVAVIAGVAIAAAESRVVTTTALLPTVTGEGLWLLVGAVVLGTVAEEVLFRGVLQSALRGVLGSWLAVVVVSAVFAAMQSTLGGAAVAVAFGASVVYGLGYELSESLLTPVVCRVTVNALLFVVVPVASARGVAIPLLA